MANMRDVEYGKVSRSEGCRRNCLKNKKKNRKNVFPLHRLPTDVIRVILSQLSFKEAARTSIVSRKWRRLWTCYPKLVLTRETMLGCNALGDHPKFGAAMYISRVDTIVRQLSSSTALNKFVAKFPLLRQDTDHIDRWVSLAAASRASRVVLDLCPEVATVINKANYSFPLHLFSGCYVKSLYLGFVSLKLPPGPNGFTNLKKLGLHMVSIMGDIQCLLPECDVLEWLSLTECSLHPYLIIHRPLQRLRYLRVLECRLHKIEMQAPNLTDFEFKNYPAPFVLGDCRNMSRASVGLLSPEYSFAYACTELPTALPHVHDYLSVSLRIRTEAQESVKGGISVFTNLRHLALSVGIDGCPQTGTGILQLACLLGLAPVLEELEIHMYCRQTPFYNHNLDETAPQHLYKHLKAVHMTGFYAIRGQLELARHILRSAVSLERMIIDPKVRVPKGQSPSDYPDLYYAGVGGVMARCSLKTREFPGTVITIL